MTTNCKYCGRSVVLCSDAVSGSIFTLDANAPVYNVEEHRYSGPLVARRALTSEGEPTAYIPHSIVCPEAESLKLPISEAEGAD